MTAEAQTNVSAAIEQFIEHHVGVSHEWALLPYVTVPLPPFLSVHALMLILGGLLLVLLFGVLYKKSEGAPHGLTNLLEALVLFVRNQIAIEFLGAEDGRRMAPLFCSFFFFILILNLMGLVPLFGAATANVNVTGALAAITLGFMVFGAMLRHGVLGFFKALAPPGVPKLMLLFLIPIEFISLFIRAFALMIRLFANMLAGHIVIFSLLGLVVLFGVWALPAVVLALGIYFMELFIGFLQAYIFTLLSAIFIGLMYHPEHE